RESSARLLSQKTLMRVPRLFRWVPGLVPPDQVRGHFARNDGRNCGAQKDSRAASELRGARGQLRGGFGFAGFALEAESRQALAATADAGRRGRDLLQRLGREAEMALKLGDTLDQACHVAQQKADLALDETRLIAHLRVLDHGLDGLH